MEKPKWTFRPIQYFKVYTKKLSESESRSVMSYSLQPHGLYSSWDSPGQNAGMGSLSLLLGIFPTQGSNPGLPHCKQILYHLSHQGSTRILECSSTPHPQLLLMKEVWLLNEGSSDSVAAPQGSTPGETVLMLCCSGQGRESRNQGISLSLLQGIFPTQELNQGLLRCRWILYQLTC